MAAPEARLFPAEFKPAWNPGMEIIRSIWLLCGFSRGGIAPAFGPEADAPRDNLKRKIL
jgi:hypothetical protein